MSIAAAFHCRAGVAAARSAAVHCRFSSCFETRLAARDVDPARDDDRRTVTAILYLNNDWKESDGGLLRFYPKGESVEDHIDIQPRAGTFVTFLSHDYWHEVLPGNRDRMSITGWFKRR